ncbi:MULTISPECIES: response regulator [Shewanella]|uniref:Two component transcriptional regulator, LuxR family n=2 Tax=Shewanella TaxID=22 RepID=B1KE04_SHEWM|nr:MULTISPECIES: response regulator transcription factor [Shewanella]ACA88006.1 two component transcriptional regulator, LuxR family [Shewanella woodyi ATCC 51908]MBW8184211.1 response regulator transcription factor [Shewanella nanhaiensis]
MRIFIVDDHPIFREGLIARLSMDDDFVIVGQAANGKEALEKMPNLMPDIVLMDISMPEMNGMDAAEIFKDKFPEIKILILSMHDDKEYVLSVLNRGVRGYALKDISAAEMFYALRVIHNGGIYYSRAISDLLVQSSQEPDKNTVLTTREQTVLRLLASGLNNKELARELDISVRTIETHRRNIKDKLAIKTSAGLVRYAIDHGLDG